MNGDVPAWQLNMMLWSLHVGIGIVRPLCQLLGLLPPQLLTPCTGALWGHSRDQKLSPPILGFFKMQIIARAAHGGETPISTPQAELLPRDCTASGSQDGHPQGLMGETTGTFLWSHVGEKGRNTDGAAKLQCSMCKEIGGCAWGQKRGLPGVVPNICFLLLGPFAQGQES